MWFSYDNMVRCASGVVHNLKHNKPTLPKVWPMNLSINIIQYEANTLGWASFVLIHGAPHVKPTMEFNELYILLGVDPSMKNGCKIHMKQCFASRHGQDDRRYHLGSLGYQHHIHTSKAYLRLWIVGSWIHYQQFVMHLLCHNWCVPKLYLSKFCFQCSKYLLM